MSTLGITRSTTLVSYCWNEPLPSGAGRGECADGTPGHPAHTLRWRAGARILVDLRLPAHDVEIHAIRITGGIGAIGGIGGRPKNVIRLDVVRVDRAGQRWTLRLPRRAARDTELLMSALFTKGDVEADLGIHRR